MAVLRRPSKTHQKSRNQEARVARDHGGKVTPGSGNRWFAKGDVKAKRFLIECKTTDKNSFRLELAVLRKIQMEAIAEGKDPAVCIDIGGVEYFVVPGYVFRNLTGENENAEAEIPPRKPRGQTDEGEE